MTAQGHPEHTLLGGAWIRVALAVHDRRVPDPVRLWAEVVRSVLLRSRTGERARRSPSTVPARRRHAPLVILGLGRPALPYLVRRAVTPAPRALVTRVHPLSRRGANLLDETGAHYGVGPARGRAVGGWVGGCYRGPRANAQFCYRPA